jgi:hypothetical protein
MEPRILSILAESPHQLEALHAWVKNPRAGFDGIGEALGIGKAEAEKRVRAALAKMRRWKEEQERDRQANLYYWAVLEELVPEAKSLDVSELRSKLSNHLRDFSPPAQQAVVLWIGADKRRWRLAVADALNVAPSEAQRLIEETFNALANRPAGES